MAASPRHPNPLLSASKRQETNYPPSEHWPPFWKQTFNEYPQLFDYSSSESKLSNSHMKSMYSHMFPNSGSEDEEYLKEGDADARHEILVPILPRDEPLGPSEALDQPLEPGPSIPVPPISPVVPSTPLFHSSPSIPFSDWTPTPPCQLRTRSSNVEDVTWSLNETTQGAVLWKGSTGLEGKANTSMTPEESSPCSLEHGNATSTVTEQSPTSNGLSLEASEVRNEVLVPSSSEERPGRKQPLGASSLRRLQLSPRRTRARRGELRTEYSTSHTIPMHLTKRNPAPKSFSPSQPLFSQPRSTSTQGLVSASVAVEETSQEMTSSDSIRIPPGQMPVSHESQESRPTQKSTAPGSLFEAFMDGPSWGMTASESVRTSPSGQIAVARETQEATLPSPSQNTGEAELPFKAPGPLDNRGHRWKSNINAMLSSSPIYPTPSVPSNSAAETPIGPMNSVSPPSDGDIVYHQYMEDNRRAKEREDSPASCEGEVEPPTEIDELDGASFTSSTDEIGESDKESDNKREGSSKQSEAMAGEEQHIKKPSCNVEVDRQHKSSQGVLEEQVAYLTPRLEARPIHSEKHAEETVQPPEGGEPQESADIGLPDTEEGGHKNQIHARLACTPVQESQVNFSSVEEARATQWEAENARRAGLVEAHGETKKIGAVEVQREARNRGEGIERMLPSEAQELQDIGLQQDLSRTHSHSSIARTVSTPLYRPEPQTRALRRLPWHLAESDSHSSSAFLSSPPPPPKQGQVLGKRKQRPAEDDVREQAGTSPPFSSLKTSVKKANLTEVLLQRPVQHQGVIKRRKIEFVDAPLVIEFEESGSDLDEVPMDNSRLKKKRDGKASAIQVQDGRPFSRNKPSRSPSVAVPDPGERKVQSSRPNLHAHQSTLRIVPSTSVRDEELPMTPLVHRPRRVSAPSNKQQRHQTYRVSSRAPTRYLSPASSLFREHQLFDRHLSGVARHSLSYIDHSNSSEFRDDVSTISTNTIPHFDFLRRKPVPNQGPSSSQRLRK